MIKFVAGRVAKMWFLKLWITSFWTETLHFLLKRWCGNVYSTSECNYQKFNKIQTKSSFGRHVGVQEYALQSMPSNMAANTNRTIFLKNQSAIKYLP